MTRCKYLLGEGGKRPEKIVVRRVLISDGRGLLLLFERYFLARCYIGVRQKWSRDTEQDAA
jgi:hypothetical protein